MHTTAEMALRLLRISSSVRVFSQVRCMSDTPGSGAGHGGGAGGTVREAGGSLGKREAALEDQYFRKLQQEQISALKDSLQDEITYHQKEINEHKSAYQLEVLHEHHHEEVQRLHDAIKKSQEDIERHQKKLEQLQQLEKKSD